LKYQQGVLVVLLICMGRIQFLPI
jgi:hypothetical protein